LRSNSRTRTARCWRCTTVRRSSGTPSTASTAVRHLKRSTCRQSSRSFAPSSQAKTQPYSRMAPQARARPSPCSATRIAMVLSRQPSTQRAGHRRHLQTDRGRPRLRVHSHHQLRRNLQLDDQGPARADLGLSGAPGRLRTRYFSRHSGITISGVTECRAESIEQVMGLLLAGNKRRTT
jgi:hypothetical protein